MAGKKVKTKGKKEVAAKDSPQQLRKEHPFETDSQIQNRYGNGREKSGSDGTHQDGRGSNH
ncbi:MAG TPA: hypothetical protein VM871_07705 [Flavisolibacter sp.]|nr:hypothetical protein [Flavisolibacter sp.]